MYMKSNNLNSIFIKKYRALKDVDLNKLSKINVFVGHNNSGKTSILEAIQLISNPFSAVVVRRIAQQRESNRKLFLRAFDLEDYLYWLFPHDDNQTGEINIEYKIDNSQEEVKFELQEILYESLFDEIDILENSEDIIERELTINVTRGEENRLLQFSDIGRKNIDRLEEKMIESLFSNSYISASDHKAMPISANQIGKIILKNKKQDFIELIRMFDQNIEEIEVVPKEIKGFKDNRVINEIYIKYYNNHELLPMFVFGDGLQKIMLVASKIIGSENGVLLIDEVETGIHTELLPRYFEWLYKLAEENNVVLFLTTHSLEAVDGIINSSKNLDHFSFYRLGKDTVKYFSGEKIYSLRNDFGQDVRY